MYLALLFYLLAIHALMDFALQGDAMATCKCRGTTNPLEKLVPWYYWLTSHALLHGAAVGVVVHWFGYDWETVIILAAAETVIHWFVDHAKCIGLFGIHPDQGAHIACKILWWALLVGGVLPVKHG